MTFWKGPLLDHALILLQVAVVAPLVFGLAARALFFRRDADDVRNRQRDAKPPINDEPGSPEPEPMRGEPWPEFPPSPS
jgi:hypothetical protein